MTDGAGRPREGTVLQGGRWKAYRPLPPEARRAALAQGLAAYDHGAYFEAHELLEPAWMGTDDLSERALHQGLIKLAAAHVHRDRRNPAGFRKNLRGARSRLADAIDGGADEAGLDLPALVEAIDDSLAALDDLDVREPGWTTEDLPRPIAIPRRPG